MKIHFLSLKNFFILKKSKKKQLLTLKCWINCDSDTKMCRITLKNGFIFKKVENFIQDAHKCAKMSTFV